MVCEGGDNDGANDGGEGRKVKEGKKVKERM
jgi:hypothetical protein